MISLFPVGYDGIVFAMDDVEPLSEHDGVSLNMQSPLLATYTNGLTGSALQLNGTGFDITGLKTFCFSNITLCRFGLTVAMWMNIDKLSSLGIVALLDFGDAEINKNGLLMLCDNVHIEQNVKKVVCHITLIINTSKWEFSFSLQLRRWIHLAVTWNSYRGMTVYINGRDISDTNKPVMLEVMPLYSDMYKLEFGQCNNCEGTYQGNSGWWMIDDLRLVERDVSVSEIRNFFGKYLCFNQIILFFKYCLNKNIYDIHMLALF